MALNLGRMSENLEFILPSPIALEYPFMMSCWSKASSRGASYDSQFIAGCSLDVSLQIVSSDNAGAKNYWERADASGPTYYQVDAYTGADAAWRFTLCNVISASSMRMQTMHPDGSITSAQNTSDASAVDLTCLWIGHSWGVEENNQVAECTLFNKHLLKANAYLPNDLVRKLAYFGPFSIQALGSSVVYYNSLLVPAEPPYISKATGAPISLYTDMTARLTSAVCAHPPLSSDYIRPAESTRALIL
jgi:hypothetical protein